MRVFFHVAGCATVDAEQCGKGFSSLSDLANETANGVAVGGRLFVFSNINFTCETKVLQWTFAAQIPDGVIASGRDPPLMQVWRETTTGYTRVFSFGDDNAALSITTEEATGEDHRMLIHYTLNEEVTVQAGDVFGLFVPDTNMPRFRPLFLDLGAGNASSYFYTSGVQSTTQNLLDSALTPEEQYVPLVAVEYG